MTSLAILLLSLLALALIGVLALRAVQIRRERQRTTSELAVAKAAHDYLARYKVKGRVVAALLPDDSMVLLIETPPQKKLRFSYIIEQPIKNFIRVHTGVDLDRIFWRFPIPPAVSQVPDVCYVDPTTVAASPPTQSEPVPLILDAAKPAESAPKVAATAPEEEDEYFRYDSYRIEEVSWEDFSTVSGGHPPSAVFPPEKK